MDIDELLALLRARLAEDELFAREATRREWYCTDNYVEDSNGGEVARFELSADARHAAGWGPARVLREVEARRQILDEFARLQAQRTAALALCAEAARRAHEMVGMFSGKKGAEVPYWVDRVRQALGEGP